MYQAILSNFMKEIILTNTKVSLVDEDIFDLISSLTWHASDAGYAQTTSLSSIKNFRSALSIGEFESVYFPTGPVKMHHIIAGQPVKGFVIDHLNGNTLDNRRENLRLVTFGVNSKNRVLHKSNKAGYQGIYWFKAVKKWRAHITVDGKYISLGFYKELADAVAVRKAAEVKFGFISR